MSETAFPGCRLLQGNGEFIKYYNPFTAAQGVAPSGTPALPGVLPAGSVVIINKQLYIARHDIPALTWGELAKLRKRQHYVVPKYTSDSFADRAKVYWDATNCRATSTAAGNEFLGYAVSNSAYGTDTNGTSSSLTHAANGYCTVISGTSADGKVGSYKSGDLWMEVEVDYPPIDTGS